MEAETEQPQDEDSLPMQLDEEDLNFFDHTAAGKCIGSDSCADP